MEDRARDPSMGVAEWRCEGVAVTFLFWPGEVELVVLLLSSRLRNWVLFMVIMMFQHRSLRSHETWQISISNA